MGTVDDEHLFEAGTGTPLRQRGWTLRSASFSTVSRLLDYNPSGGMWQATGTAIAHAPNETDLRSPYDVGFDVHGRSVLRIGSHDAKGPSQHRTLSMPTIDLKIREGQKFTDDSSKYLPLAQAGVAPRIPWSQACKKGFIAAWRFICTPTGLFITIYRLNVVAWGAMLFFLLLNVGTIPKERKEVWIEIDSQILNGLFCLTSWGLAPWRIRDTYWLLVWRFGSGRRSKNSIGHLAKRNMSWFRMPLSSSDEAIVKKMPCKTSTGKIAPPTKKWKMDFVVINMLLNSLFQIGMATFMWEYNRHNRPSFAVGLFIGLGCFSSLLAGVMSWWEGRKIKKTEGPILQETEEEKIVPMEIHV